MNKKVQSQLSTLSESLETLRVEVSEQGRLLNNALLDYANLYDKVRTTLGKIAKRQAVAENGAEAVEDPVTKARALLLEKKLSRRQI